MASKDRPRVAILLTNLNTKYLIQNCLDSIKRHTSYPHQIFVWDNASTDGTTDMLRGQGFIRDVPVSAEHPRENRHTVFMRSEACRDTSVTVDYVRMPENTGGAGGFHEGVRTAYEAGCEWVWLMDDDVAPDERCLAELIAETENLIVWLSEVCYSSVPIASSLSVLRRVHR